MQGSAGPLKSIRMHRCSVARTVPLNSRNLERKESNLDLRVETHVALSIRISFRRWSRASKGWLVEMAAFKFRI